MSQSGLRTIGTEAETGTFPPEERGTTGVSRLAAPREEVRVALLQAVERLMQRFGYRKTSVEDIAQEAGVSRATAYLYFSGKEALVMAWIEQRNRQHLALLQQITASETTAPARVFTFLLARILTRFDGAQPYLKDIDELQVALRTRLPEHRRRHQEAEAAFVAELLRDGIEKLDFAALPDPLQTARWLLLATNALLPYNLSARELGERAAVEADARGLIGLLLGGLMHGGFTEDGSLSGTAGTADIPDHGVSAGEGKGEG